VNGSELVDGLTANLPAMFLLQPASPETAHTLKKHTLSGRSASKNIIAVVGFYGNNLKIGYGSMGGWDPFGPERLITKSKGNVLLELDNQSALDIYKLYLGEHAKELPASGLRFP
jgi:hypothetical protein